MVNVCGRLIDEELLVKTNSVSYEDWLRFATFDLDTKVIKWPTMGKLVSVLESPSVDISEMRSLLSRRFLPNISGIRLNNLREITLAQFLTAEGALVQDPVAETFEVRLSILLLIF